MINRKVAIYIHEGKVRCVRVCEEEPRPLRCEIDDKKVEIQPRLFNLNIPLNSDVSRYEITQAHWVLANLELRGNDILLEGNPIGSVDNHS